MGRVVARRGDEVEPEIGRETEVDGKKQWALKSKLYFDPTKDPMYLRIVHYAPGYAEPTHSHTADELIYILEGDVDRRNVVQGRRRCLDRSEHALRPAQGRT